MVETDGARAAGTEMWTEMGLTGRAKSLHQGGWPPAKRESGLWWWEEHAGPRLDDGEGGAAPGGAARVFCVLCSARRPVLATSNAKRRSGRGGACSDQGGGGGGVTELIEDQRLGDQILIETRPPVSRVKPGRQASGSGPPLLSLP